MWLSAWSGLKCVECAWWLYNIVMHHADCPGCVWKRHQHHHLSDEGILLWHGACWVAFGWKLEAPLIVRFLPKSICICVQMKWAATDDHQKSNSDCLWGSQQESFLTLMAHVVECLKWLEVCWVCLVIIQHCHAPRRLPRLRVEKTPTSPSFGWRHSVVTWSMLGRCWVKAWGSVDR